MQYDWGKIEREQQQQAARNLRPLAIAWIAFGLVGSMIALLTGHSERLVGLLGWLVIGLVFYLGTRRHAEQRHQAAKAEDLE